MPPQNPQPQNPPQPPPAPAPTPPPAPQQPVPPAQPTTPQQPVVPAPTPPMGPTTPPMQPPLASQPKKKGKLWLILAIVAVVVLVLGAITFVIVKKPKQYTGNYTRFATYKSTKPSDAGNFSFDYPVNMTITKEEPNEVRLEQQVKPDQILKTKENWESRIFFVADWCDCYNEVATQYSKSGLNGSNEVITYFGSIAKKVLEKEGMTDVSVEGREDLSNIESGKLVMDYSFKDPQGVVIKGRRIIYLTKNTLASIAIVAIDKVWDEHRPAWDDITESFEVKPAGS